jgi:hypothetical protein
VEWACNTHRRDEKCIKNFWLGILKGRECPEDQGVEGMIVVDLILEK